jgi:hypothetical protein
VKNIIYSSLKYIVILFVSLIFISGNFTQISFTDSGQNLGNDDNLFIQLGDIYGDGDLDAVEEPMTITIL